TTLNAGDLFVDGSIAGATTVNGGRLAGTGSVGGVTANGGTVAPGDNPRALPRVLTANGNTALTNRSTFLVDITGPTPGNVLGAYSQLVVNGALALGGATLSGIIGNGFIPAAVGAAPTFTIVHSTGALTGQFAQGSTVFLNGMKFAITYDRLANNV